MSATGIMARITVKDWLRLFSWSKGRMYSQFHMYSVYIQYVCVNSEMLAW